MCLCCAENVQKMIGVSQGNTTLKYKRQDNIYFEKKKDKYIYLYTGTQRYCNLEPWRPWV